MMAEIKVEINTLSLQNTVEDLKQTLSELNTVLKNIENSISVKVEKAVAEMTVK